MSATALARFAQSSELQRLWLRIGALAALYLLFEALEWTWLHRSVRASVALVLEYLNHGVLFGVSEPRSSYLFIDGSQFRITRGCTYANLGLTIAPFMWRFHRNIVRNAAWLMGWFVALYMVNVVRLALAAHFHLGDWDWSIAHDWPDRILRWSIVVPAVWMALRSDRNAHVRETNRL